MKIFIQNRSKTRDIQKHYDVLQRQISEKAAIRGLAEIYIEKSVGKNKTKLIYNYNINNTCE